MINMQSYLFMILIRKIKNVLTSLYIPKAISQTQIKVFNPRKNTNNACDKEKYPL